MQTTLFLLVALCIFYLLMGRLFITKRYPVLEAGMLSLALVFLLCVTLTFLLALAGIYSLWLLTGLLLVGAGGFFVIATRKKTLVSPREMVSQASFKPWHLVVLIGVSFIVILYLAFPTYYWFGGRDHGLYVINGVHLAQTGGFTYEDPVRSSIYSLIGEDLLGYPGLYSVTEYNGPSSGVILDSPFAPYHGAASSSTLMPQFAPLYFCVSALAYSLFGLGAVFRINGLVTLLSLGIMYYFCKRIFSSTTAVIAAVLMSLNPAQLWNGKIPGSEMFSQLFLFLLLYFFAQAWQNHSKNMAFFASLFLGLNLFCRIDSFIYGISVFVLWFYTIIFDPQREKLARILSVTYIIFALLSIGYLYWNSWEYLFELWATGSLKGILFLNLFALLTSLATFCICRGIRKKTLFLSRNFFWAFLDMKFTLFVICCALFVLFLFAYFLRPIMSGVEPGTLGYLTVNAMSEFCWYTSFLAPPLAIGGMYYTLHKTNFHRSASLLFLLLGMPSLLGYIYNPSISPDHFWASRRWVTICIPFVIILAAHSIVCLSRYKGKIFLGKALKFAPRALAIFAGFLILIFSVWQSRLFLFSSILRGMPNQVRAMANTLDNNAIYFTTDTRIPGPLRYVFDKPVYWVDSLDNLPFEIEGRKVYVIETALADNFVHKYQIMQSHTLSGFFPEESLSKYPQVLAPVELPYNIYSISSNDTDRLYWAHEELYAAGFKAPMATGLENQGTAGVLLYGPYQPLRAGSYSLTVTLAVDEHSNTSLGSVDIACEFGETQIAYAELSSEFVQNGTIIVTIPFDAIDAADYEYRIFANDGVFLEVVSIELQKL